MLEDKVFANKKFEDKWSLLQIKYDEWRDKFIPCKLVKTGQRHKPPWTNFKSVRTAKRKKRVAAVKAKKSGLNVHQELFAKAKANVDSSIYKAKMDYEDMLVNQIKTEPKKFITTQGIFVDHQLQLKCWNTKARSLPTIQIRQKF